MKIRDVLTEEVTTCRLGTNLAAATALMWEKDCGVLPVLVGNGELAGMITDRDICIALGTRNRRASELTASDVLGVSPLACRSRDDIRLALQIMGAAKIRRLPVIGDDGALEGIVSISDIVLSARRSFGTTGGAGLSFGEIVAALQAIYTRHENVSSRSAAA